MLVRMELSDFVNLGLKDYGQGEVLEVYWVRPDRNSPHLVIRRNVHFEDGMIGRDPELDESFGNRGFLLGYYSRLVGELPEEYKKGNVEPPFIEVCPTKERNGVANNNIVQIPLSYIPVGGIVQLSKKT